ncbi:MAG: efflux RND transporter permease subunit [Minisyncoccia bacterium]
MTALWTFFINKDRFTILLGIVLSLAGIYAAFAIPKESSPEVQIPLGIITTILPGAGSEDIERLITDKIENQVLGVERVSKVTSVSSAGVSSITVEFDANANIDKSIQLLKDEVDKVRSDLPSEAEDPVVTDVNFADQPIIIASISGELAPAELTALGESLKDELERIPGVSKVALSGIEDRQVQVIVKQAKLREYNLSLSDVTNAIRASGAASPAGSITVNDISYAVRFEAGINEPEDVANVAIAGPGGISLHVRDVADVVNGLADASTFSRVSVAGAPSAPALSLSIFKSRGGNIVETGNAVKQKVTDLEKTLLAGTKTVISFDAAEQVQKDLTELTRTGIETVILVMLMLFATLGWRESLAAALSIPLSFLIAFIGIYASGNTINFVSLFSLILAIGILVDSGIVVVEAIHTRLVHTGNKRDAAIAAIREYAWPLVAGTFTTVAVFIPLFFLSGVVGKFIASIPFTVIFVLIASIFVALGLIPLLSMYIIRPTQSRIEERQEEYNEIAKAWYQGILRRILGNRRIENWFVGSMVALFFVALALPALGAVNTVFFPPEDSDFVYVSIEKPQGTALTQTDLSVREVEELLYSDPRITSFVAEVGAGSSFSGSASSGSNLGNITVNLDKDRKETSQEIVADLRKLLPHITSAVVTVGEPAGGPPSAAPVLITFSGDDLTTLASTALTAERILADIPGVTNVVTSSKDSGTEFVVKLDTAKATELGVSSAFVADTIRTALYGAKAASIRTGTEDIEVHTKLDLNPNYQSPNETTHTSIDAVRAMTVLGKNGPVPLASIATITYEPAETTIRHENGTRIATVQSDVTGKTPIQITNEFEKEFASVVLPSGVTMKLGGESEDVNKSFAEMGIALLAGAALMLAILVLEFNGFRHSLYLLSIIPLSLIGVLVGLMLTGAPLSFSSMLGVIALAGVIINHAIILMDSISRIGRENPNETLTEVVIHAASTRFRPIVLTTVVTVVGMIPLSFASPLWGPLAFSIMFGLAFSLLLTLVFIPILYHRWPGKKVLARFTKSNAAEVA